MHKKVVFKSYSQNQQFLLPKNIDDFVIKGHIARLISKIIDNMDIQYIIATYKGGGTSSYNPRILLKAWILGFVYRIYSCRLLAKAIRENLPFIWIAGNQQPNFRTLNNFRLRLKEDIKKIFKEIVKYALEKGIIEGKDIFIDHTKRDANSNKYKIVWRKQVENQLNKIDEELDKLFKHIDELNEEEEKTFGSKDLPEQERAGFDNSKVGEIIDKINEDIKNKKITNDVGKEHKREVRRIRELLERKEKYNLKKDILSNRNSYSRTDNDAVAMMMKDKITIRPAYNEGVAVENGFVLDYVISDNCADNLSFIPLMDGMIDNIGKIPENAHSDGAYGNEENMLYLNKRKIGNFLKYNTYHREKKRNWKEKNKFEELTYDKKKDEFVCPSGIKLKFEKEKPDITKTGYKHKTKVYRSGTGRCDKCNFHRAKAKTLSLSWKYERLKKQAKSNLSSTKGIELRKRRGNEVESVFGDSKLNKNKRRYNLRGMKKVTLEAGLYYIAHNIMKIKNKLHSFNEQILFSLKFV
ncbi:IS1182 family transposase [Candidatus Woesearchaeota archaeon]|nr:IS1182 family transposase [Candidatus Woesearchaeota archaeon]MBI4154707.1 IS1182 family transposase [Candidatus Woesearchaeota archaeon]